MERRIELYQYFIEDCLRIVKKSTVLLSQFQTQNTECNFHVLEGYLHTLKGTCALHPEGQIIVEGIHRLEGMNRLEKSPKIKLTNTQQALQWVFSYFKLLEQKLKLLQESNQIHVNPKECGFLFESNIDGIKEKFWIPIESLLGIWSECSFGEVPVEDSFGDRAQATEAVAVFIQQRVYVFFIHEVYGFVSKEAAKEFDAACQAQDWLASTQTADQMKRAS